MHQEMDLYSTPTSALNPIASIREQVRNISNGIDAKGVEISRFECSKLKCNDIEWPNALIFRMTI